MALDRDATAGKIDRPAAPAEHEPPPLPPDRPGAEGMPSRAASRAAARAPDRPAAPAPPEATGKTDLDGPEPREATDDDRPEPVSEEAEDAAERPDDDVREPADEAENGEDGEDAEPEDLERPEPERTEPERTEPEPTEPEPTEPEREEPEREEAGGVDDEAEKAAGADDSPDAEPPSSEDGPGPEPAPRAPVRASDQAEPSPDADADMDGGGWFGASDSSRPDERRGESADRPLFPTVTDQSGYAFSEREFGFAGVSPEQAWDMRTQRVPLGMRPEQWDECVVELRAALASDGFGDAEVRLQGPGARFCSQDPRRWFPQNESELRARVIQHHRGASDDERLRRADNAVAKYRSAGFSQERPKPIAPFFDSMHKLDVADEPDGYEFHVTGESVTGRFHDIEQQDAQALRGWARRWEDATGRGVSLSAAESLREDDWMVVDPEDGEGRGEK